MTPTARSLAYLRARGACAEVVEQMVRVPAGPGRRPRAFRRDLLGCLDIVAIEPGRPGVLGVQACRTADQANRLAKIRFEPRARLWLQAGNRILVIGWAKRGARGARKVWQPSITEVTIEMLAGVATDGKPAGNRAVGTPETAT